MSATAMLLFPDSFCLSFSGSWLVEVRAPEVFHFRVREFLPDRGPEGGGRSGLGDGSIKLILALLSPT